jgi:hypothetical protein
VRKGIDTDMSLERVLKGRTPDVWVTINGIPIFLAVNQVRLLEVRGNENGDRALKIEEILKASSSKPILCMVNGGSLSQKYPWAAFEIAGFEAVGDDGSETHIGPYDMRAIGLGATFCAHFKGPQCVYKLGRLLGTNIKKKEWQPVLPSPKEMYWKKLRKEGVIPKDGSVNAFKKSSHFSQEKLQNYVDTVMAEREGKCEKCRKVRVAKLKTY